MSISAKSAASTPPASDRMVTSASRWSYSPESSVRTSSAEMSSRSLARSASASARRPRRPRPRPARRGRQVVEPGAQRRRARRRSPCVWASRLVTFCAASGSFHRSGGPASASQVARCPRAAVEVDDRLDALQGGGELFQVGCYVGVHNSPGYAAGVTARRRGQRRSRLRRPVSRRDASSSFSTARAWATANSATALPYGSSRPRAAAAGRVQPRRVGRPGRARPARRAAWASATRRAGAAAPAGCARVVGPAPAASHALNACLPAGGDGVLLATPADPACPA